jgi:hypothetical protein
MLYIILLGSVFLKALVLLDIAAIFAQLCAVRREMRTWQIQCDHVAFSLYPLTCILFGLAGFWGMLRLIIAKPDHGKTGRE